jgi:hypothetical protein
VEAEQAHAGLSRLRASAISPGESLMPHEIVQHCRLNREGCCPQVVEAEGGQRFQNCKLDQDSDGSYENELRRALYAGVARKRLNAAFPRSAFHQIFSSR